MQRKLVSLLVVGLALASRVMAQTTTVFDDGTVLSDNLAAAEVFFGVVVALCVLVTGFFLGRKWLRSI